MEKLNNILNREDYIKAVNEGRIGNFLKKGVEKIKSLFSFVTKKVKNFIVLFDKGGNVMPVVSPQALADHFKGNEKIQVFGTKEMDREIKDAGGIGCETTAVSRQEDSYDDETPNGQKAFFDWCNTEFKNTNYYKNLMTLQSVVESRMEKFSKDDLLNERLEDDQRISYKGKAEGKITGVENFNTMSSKKFEKAITDRIDYWCKKRTRPGEHKNQPGNILIFGAPGIGKSTIPRNIVKAFNEDKEPSERIGLISVNCANLQPGDLLMPSFPKPKDIMHYLETNKTEFANLAFLDNLSPEQKEKLSVEISKSNQVTAKNAPAPWLPCYKKTGDKFVDGILNRAANGGILAGDKKEEYNEYTDEYEDVQETYKTGSGGIILLDEFLRSDPRVFSELLNFLFEREVDDWTLGSKWFIMACSNRPCDDTEVDNNWKGWNSAQRGRWPEIWNFEPSPEEWKEWARKKGFDENLLKFIFDETSEGSVDANGEYTRWHRMAQKDSSAEDSHQMVSPRNWMFIHDKFMLFAEQHRDEERFKNGFSTSDMSIEEIREVLEGVTDVEFAEEIIDWFEKFCGDFSIEKIIEDPINTPSPLMGKVRTNGKVTGSVEGKDETRYNEVTIIDAVIEGLRDRYNKENKNAVKPTDKELSNVMIWLGINFKNNFNVISSIFANQLHYVLGDNGFWDFHKFGMMFMAAFPEKDYMEVIDYPGLKEVLADTSHGNGCTDFFLKEGEDMLETVKGFAKQYFPWRLNGDELVTIYESTEEPEKTEEEKEEE